MDLPIYENQQKAGTQIFKALIDDEVKHVILAAIPQSGKTGAARQAAILAKEYDSEIRVIVISGMNDLNLKDQTEREWRGLADKIYFSQDLLKFVNRESVFDFYKVLLFMDESHFAQNAVNRLRKKVILSEEDDSPEEELGKPCVPFRFLTEVVGITLDGQVNKWKPEMAKDFVGVVSISATAMSEIAHLDNPEVDCPKKVVSLQPGAAYYGFSKMFANGRIKQAFNLNNKVDLLKLSQVLQGYQHEQALTKKFKYALIRFNNNEKGRGSQEEFRRLLAKTDIDITVLSCQEKNIKELHQILAQAPKRLTVIIIYNSLRAGVQLDTSHVRMVHENMNAGADVTAQGLPGRCGGYNKADHEVDIYCNVKMLRKYLTWQQRGFDPGYIPAKSRNIKRAGAEAGPQKEYVPNKVLGAKLFPEEIRSLEVYRQTNGRSYPNFWDRYEDMILDHLTPLLDDPDFWEDYKFIGVMIIDDDNSDGTKTRFWKSPWKACDDGRAIQGFTAREKEKMKEHDHGFYIFINLMKDVQKSADYLGQYGWMVMTSIKPSSEEPRRIVLTTKNEQYHPDNNPDLSVELEDDQILDLEIPPDLSLTEFLVDNNELIDIGHLQLRIDMNNSLGKSTHLSMRFKKKVL